LFSVAPSFYFLDLIDRYNVTKFFLNEFAIIVKVISYYVKKDFIIELFLKMVNG